MKKLITSAAVVLGLAVAGNAMAQETILNTMTKANNALEEAQQKIDAKKAAREQAQQEKADAVKLQMDDTDAKIKAEQERLRNNLDNLKKSLGTN